MLVDMSSNESHNRTKRAGLASHSKDFGKGFPLPIQRA
jgi:hypothetical protein